MSFCVMPVTLSVSAIECVELPMGKHSLKHRCSRNINKTVNPTSARDGAHMCGLHHNGLMGNNAMVKNRLDVLAVRCRANPKTMTNTRRKDSVKQVTMPCNWKIVTNTLPPWRSTDFVCLMK